MGASSGPFTASMAWEQAASGAKLDDLAALQRTLSIMSADLAQATARPVRDERGTVLPAFVGENGAGQPILRLVRGGWTNLDAQPRAGVRPSSRCPIRGS